MRCIIAVSLGWTTNCINWLQYDITIYDLACKHDTCNANAKRVGLVRVSKTPHVRRATFRILTRELWIFQPRIPSPSVILNPKCRINNSASDQRTSRTGGRPALLRSVAGPDGVAVHRIPTPRTLSRPKRCQFITIDWKQLGEKCTTGLGESHPLKRRG